MNDDLRKMAPWLGGILAVALVAMLGRGLFGSALTGTEAPALDLPIAAGAGALEGDRVSLASLRGRVVVLDFWASWCGPCRRSIPILNDLEAELAGEPVTFLGVNVEGEMGPRRLQQVHTELGAHFPTLQDRTGEVKARYGVSVLPTLVVLDGEGVVRHVGTGVPSEDSLRATIRELIPES
ncbi:MAG: TlpA family protein disulfide reductase [Myxococcales bacterium]|nr:TlpA family protein disulfide reductase [Myxococcales bacterium]MCB9629540.1 TlpA family protein disulfide reductase [Sandaracinaceae bacterium]